jgi:hypothetical protein
MIIEESTVAGMKHVGSRLNATSSLAACTRRFLHDALA